MLVLNSDVRQGNAIFETAAFVILASILIHGATDTLGASGSRRIEATGAGEEADPGSRRRGPMP